MTSPHPNPVVASQPVTTITPLPGGGYQVTAQHTYTDHKVYTVIAQGNEGRVGSTAIDTRHAPLQIDWTPDGTVALKGMLTIVSTDAPPGVELTVFWGDGTEDGTIILNGEMGETTGTAEHTYTGPGIYTIEVHDENYGWTAEITVEVGEQTTPLTLTWEPSEPGAAAGFLTIADVTTWPVLVEWGDGTTTLVTSDQNPKAHIYGAPAKYLIVATDHDHNAGSTTAKVDPGDLALETSPHDLNPMICYVRATPVAGQVCFTFHDPNATPGTTERCVASTDGVSDWAGYYFEQPGEYTITAVDDAGQEGNATYLAASPETLPTISWAEGDDPMSGVLYIEDAYGGGYTSWGDGTHTTIELGEETSGQMDHTYLEPGIYDVQFKDAAYRSVTIVVQVPSTI